MSLYKTSEVSKTSDVCLYAFLISPVVQQMLPGCGGRCQFIAAVIVFVIGMAAHPLEFDMVFGSQFRVAHPEVAVFFAAGEIGHHRLYGYTGVLTVFTAAA